MKSPPKQLKDDDAYAAVEQFIKKHARKPVRQKAAQTA
jgi:hypothetical protein